MGDEVQGRKLELGLVSCDWPPVCWGLQSIVWLEAKVSGTVMVETDGERVPSQVSINII